MIKNEYYLLTHKNITSTSAEVKNSFLFIILFLYFTSIYLKYLFCEPDGGTLLNQFNINEKHN
jgi:hypothetical protein